MSENDLCLFLTEVVGGSRSMRVLIIVILALPCKPLLKAYTTHRGITPVLIIGLDFVATGGGLVAGHAGRSRILDSEAGGALGIDGSEIVHEELAGFWFTLHLNIFVLLSRFLLDLLLGLAWCRLPRGNGLCNAFFGNARFSSLFGWCSLLGRLDSSVVFITGGRELATVVQFVKDLLEGLTSVLCVLDADDLSNLFPVGLDQELMLVTRILFDVVICEDDEGGMV